MFDNSSTGSSTRHLVSTRPAFAAALSSASAFIDSACAASSAASSPSSLFEQTESSERRGVSE